LAEDEKSSDIGQKITDVARSERNGLLIILMGVFLVNAGLIVSVMGDNSIAYVGGISFIILGIFSTMFGFYVSVHYSRQYSKLLT